MIRAIYLDGERFETMKDASAYIQKRWGKQISGERLRREAERKGTIAEGKGKWVRVSWTGEGAEAVAEEPAPRVIRRGSPLLRYPPGAGPRYDWSRRWR